MVNRQSICGKARTCPPRSRNRNEPSKWLLPNLQVALEGLAVREGMPHLGRFGTANRIDAGVLTGRLQDFAGGAREVVPAAGRKA